MEDTSEAGRKLRVKERKQYSEDCLQDVDIEGQRMFSVEEKLLSDKFPQDFVLEMKGDDLTLEYFQREGFTQPMVFKEKKGLGIRVPSEHFSVNDVRQCVGSRRIVDVMDVTTQKDQEMTMKEWCHYFEEKPREKLLNVISLEFSHTKLENYVESPDMVRLIDWVDCAWPRHLKESQTVGTNTIENMKYPKVQKYCLMSVKGCYTDFHIDFGGTSVWYHIIKGQKVFWLIPPTEDNIRHYEKWVLSGKQGDVFFGDTVPKCARIYLEQGYTFLIPTGWIHAVYTPADSIVFGGNFLHSFGIEKQLRICEVEDTTKVPFKFRYPFNTELLWYVLQRYVLCVNGKNHLTCNEDGEPLADENTDPSKELKVRPNKNGIKPVIHLTKYELSGLKALIKYLERLPAHKRFVPSLIRNADLLLKDAKDLVKEHSADDQLKAITGKPILTWPEKSIKVKKKAGRPCKWENHAPSSKKTPTTFKNGLIRHRRTRCKRCEPCQRNDCEECNFCRDMKKFGGPGRMKQSCRMRQCVGPVLAHSAICNICKEDGWQKKDALLEWLDDEDLPCLMECSLCWEITHPSCLLATRNDSITPHYNDDLPNSWQCIKCLAEGAPEEVKPRSMKIKKFKTYEDENGDISQEEKKRKYRSEDEDSNHSLKKRYTQQRDVYLKQEKDSSDDSTLPSSNSNFPLKNRLLIKPPLCSPFQEDNFDYLFETSSSDMDEDEDTLDSTDDGAFFDARPLPSSPQLQASKGESRIKMESKTLDQPKSSNESIYSTDLIHKEKTESNSIGQPMQTTLSSNEPSQTIELAYKVKSESNSQGQPMQTTSSNETSSLNEFTCKVNSETNSIDLQMQSTPSYEPCYINEFAYKMESESSSLDQPMRTTPYSNEPSHMVAYRVNSESDSIDQPLQLSDSSNESFNINELAYRVNSDLKTKDQPMQQAESSNVPNHLSQLEQDVLKTVSSILDKSVSLSLEESVNKESLDSDVCKNQKIIFFTTYALPNGKLADMEQGFKSDSILSKEEKPHDECMPIDTNENLDETLSEINQLEEMDVRMTDPSIDSFSPECQSSCSEISQKPNAVQTESILEEITHGIFEPIPFPQETSDKPLDPNIEKREELKNENNGKISTKTCESENSDDTSSFENFHNYSSLLREKCKSIEIKVVLKPLDISEINRIYSQDDQHPKLIKHNEHKPDTSTFTENSQGLIEMDEFNQKNMKAELKPLDIFTDKSQHKEDLQSEIPILNQNDAPKPSNESDEKSIIMLEDSQDTIEMKDNFTPTDSHKVCNRANEAEKPLPNSSLLSEAQSDNTFASSNNLPLSTISVISEDSQPTSSSILENKDLSPISYPFRYRKCKNITYLPYKTINLLNKLEVMEVLSHPKAPQVVLKKLDDSITNALLSKVIPDKDTLIGVNQSLDDKQINNNEEYFSSKLNKNQPVFPFCSPSKDISSATYDPNDLLNCSSSQVTSASTSSFCKDDEIFTKHLSSCNPATLESLRPISSFPEHVPTVKKTHSTTISKPKEIILTQNKHIMIMIFRFLSHSELFACQLVCKSWNEWVLDPQLWESINVSHKQITPYLLMGIVKRQPVTLDLSHTSILGTHVSWLIARLPNLKHLVMTGCSLSAITALWTAYCPYLHSLNISSVIGLGDSVLDRLLSLPEDSNSKRVKNRLRQLRNLDISHTDISDVSIRLIAHRLPWLTSLKAAGCSLITDMGIAVLGATRYSMLKYLDLSSCSAISDTSLEALSKCSHLTSLDLRDCSQVSENACKKFASTHHAAITAFGKLLRKL